MSSELIRVPVSRPQISEEEIHAVQEEMRALNLSGHSNSVSQFEEELAKYLDVREVIAVSNGTVALDLSIEALEINKSDLCIVPSFTIISTVAELARRGARIKLVDSNPISWSMDVNKTLDLIDSSVKLVLPVHIYGLSVDMNPLLEAQNRFGFKILEDAAEALSVKYRGRLCGTFGDLSTFSFYANKLITCGEGGAIATNNLELSEQLRSLRNLRFSKTERFVHDGLGYNARLSGLSATLAKSQLKRITELSNRKRALVSLYQEGLKNHPWLEYHIDQIANSKNEYWVFGILMSQDAPFKAKQLQSKLESEGIETRRFFCPLHLQPFIRDYNFEFIKDDMKVSEALWERGLYLPFGTGIREDEVVRVIETLWKLVRD